MGFVFLGQNLRDLRTARRQSQHALADQAGPPFSQSYISRLERGLVPSDVGHVDILAAALGVSPRRLLQRPRHVRATTSFPLRDSRNGSKGRDPRHSSAAPPAALRAEHRSKETAP
jgi:transcriptional regulator with XRE-family HTH domain